MRRSLVDFLNHGTTPFVGRDHEVERILSFLGEGEGERNGLEALLLLGEAGVGKSRLIESCIAQGESSLQAILHIRLRPEGSLHFARMIGEGIERSPTARELFSSSTQTDDLAEGVGRIRRLSALRRTGLVIEDLHLLAGERLNEFLYILDMLRDEPIGLLAAARPVNSPARGILEPYLREEITLGGLSTDDIQALWRTFFDQSIDGKLAAVLWEVTGGNPLALRSALRSSIRNGLFSDGGNGGTLLDVATFREIGLRNVHSLAEGMTADLQEPMRRGLERLALLGEAFSPEAAEVLLGESDELLRTLIFRGILVRSLTPVVPVNTIWSFEREGRNSRGPVERSVTPFAFTHTLLHFDLLQHAKRPVADLITLLASGAPLLTYYPYRLLIESLEQQGVEGIDRGVMLEAIDRTSQAARSINIGAEWERAPLLLQAAQLLFLQIREELDLQVRDEFEALLLLVELEAGFRPNRRSGRGPTAQRIYDLTLGREEERMMHIHLKALSFLFRVEVEDGGPGDFAEGLALVDRHPGIRSSREYVSFIHMVANTSVNRLDTKTLALLRRRIELDLSDDSLPDWVRDYLRRRLLPHFFELYENPREFEETLQVIAELDRHYPPIESLYEISDLPFYSMKLSFWVRACMFRDILRVGPAVVLHARRFSLDGTDTTAMRQIMIARGLLDRDPLQIKVGFEEYLQYCGSKRPSGGNLVARALSLISLLRDDPELCRWGLERLGLSTDCLHLGEWIGLLLQEENYEEFRDLVDRLPEGLRPLAMICYEKPEDPEGIITQYVAQFDNHEYTLFSLIRYHNAFDLVARGMAEGNISLTQELKRSMREAMRHILEFLVERRLPVVIEPFLRRHGAVLPLRERKDWELRAAAIQTGSRSQGGRSALTMLDAITLSDREGEPALRVRGGRSRHLLGLLTAMKMVRHRFDRAEFFRLASGVEGDPERARTSTNVALLRLRELVGRDLLRTRDDLPELDTDLVRVDLLDLWEALQRVEQEMATGHLVRAREELNVAIAETAGKIPFPGLYDRLFEGLRDEVEGRMRSLLISVSARLLASDDPVGAEELLRSWVASIPDDEEARELLSESLRRQGRDGEAALTTPG